MGIYDGRRMIQVMIQLVNVMMVQEKCLDDWKKRSLVV